MSTQDFEAYLHRMPQTDVATLLEVDRKTVRRWESERGLPRNSDGSYNWPAVMWWAIAMKRR